MASYLSSPYVDNLHVVAYSRSILFLNVVVIIPKQFFPVIRPITSYFQFLFKALARVGNGVVLVDIFSLFVRACLQQVRF